MLFKVMEILPALEEWRETLPPVRRLRMNHPSTVLKNYKAIETDCFPVLPGPAALLQAAPRGLAFSRTMSLVMVPPSG